MPDSKAAQTATESTTAQPPKGATNQPAKAEPDKKWDNLRKRLRLLRRPLAFIGIVLVFATFVVREALREKYKDFADSINQAQDRFQSYQEAVFTRGILNNIQSGLAEYRLRPESSTGRFTRDFREREELIRERALSSLSLHQNLVDSTWSLVSELPNTKEKQALAMKLSQLHQQLDELQALVSSQPRDSKERVEFLSQMMKFTLLGRQFSIDIVEFEKSAVKEAKKKRDDYELRYRWCTNGSYILYGLAFLVTVAGKLTGVDNGAGD